VTGPTDVVETLVDRWLSGARDSACGLLAEDCLFSLLRSQPFRGLEAFEDFLDEMSQEDRTATVTPLSFLGQGEKVVMLGQVAFARSTGGRGYTERQAFAWVFTVQDGKIAAIKTYPSWAEAKEDAGVADAAPEVERRRTFPPQLMRALRPGEATGWA
jgi:ketosteroid isomerase-like protein